MVVHKSDVNCGCDVDARSEVNDGLGSAGVCEFVQEAMKQITQVEIVVVLMEISLVVVVVVLEGRLDEGLVSCYGSCLNKPVSYIFYSSFCLSAFVYVYLFLCLALLRFQVHRLFFISCQCDSDILFIFFLLLPPLSPFFSLSFSLCLAI